MPPASHDQNYLACSANSAEGRCYTAASAGAWEKRHGFHQPEHGDFVDRPEQAYFVAANCRWGLADGSEFCYIPPPANPQTRVCLDDALKLSPLELAADDRALVLAADGGDAEAQCDLGLLLLGQGRAEDALGWFEASARQDYPEGMHWLGRCLIAGQGAMADEKRGIDFIARAANRGHATARRMMPFLYDPARPALSPAELDAALDGIERKLVLAALEETAD